MVFCTVEIFAADDVHGSITRHRANLVKIGQTVTGISRFTDFSKMAVVRHLGFAGRVFGPRTNSTRQF